VVGGGGAGVYFVEGFAQGAHFGAGEIMAERGQGFGIGEGFAGAGGGLEEGFYLVWIGYRIWHFAVVPESRGRVIPLRRVSRDIWGRGC